MKKLLLLLSVVCLAALAEASFDQIETLIEKQQYSAAASGLEGIIANHPNSAKAYYAMAQAQAGMGNQEKARYALNKARGIDPELKFAPAASVQSLEVAITPQVKKIEAVHETDYTWMKVLAIFGVLGLAFWYYKSEEEKKKELAEKLAQKERDAEIERTRAARAAAKETMKTPTPEASKWTNVQTPQQAPAAPAAPAPAAAPSVVYVQQPTQTVVHHTSNNDGLLTGMMLNEMMHTHSHDTTRVVEREVIREVPAAPAPSRDSSWDDNSSSSSSWFSSSPSKSSSWDSSSSSSSSWGSSSSSSSDSSWSSSSDSSSSWD